MRTWTFIVAIAAGIFLVGSFASAETAEENAIARKIAASLKQSGRLKDYRVGVKYQDGVAWLEGMVATEEQFQTAVELTQSMPSVSYVVSKLQVSGGVAASQGEVASDGFLPSVQPASAQGAPPASNRMELRPSQKPLAAGSFGRPRRSAVRGGPSQLQRSRPVASAQVQRVALNRQQTPLPAAQTISLAGGHTQQADYAAACPPGAGGMYGQGMAPMASSYVPGGGAVGVSYDQAQMPGYAWPSYASYPNYAGLTYPRQYSPTAWPYIGPFYPYPQVPLGWRKVTLEWDDGWWFLDFSDTQTH